MAKFSSKTGTPVMVKYAAKELGIDLSGLERDEVITRLNQEEPGVYDTGDAQNGGGSGTEPQGGGSGTEPKGGNETNGGGSGTEPSAKNGDVSLLGGGSGTEPKKKVITGYTIVIPASESQFKDNFVQVGVNGNMHKIMKDVEVDVSIGIHDVLTNAVEIDYDTVTDPDTKMKSLKAKKTKRWPFQIIETHYE